MEFFEALGTDGKRAGKKVFLILDNLGVHHRRPGTDQRDGLFAGDAGRSVVAAELTRRNPVFDWARVTKKAPAECVV